MIELILTCPECRWKERSVREKGQTYNLDCMRCGAEMIVKEKELEK